MTLLFKLQKLIFVCDQAVRQTVVAVAKTAGKPKEATHLGALAVAHFFEKEKKAALQTKTAAQSTTKKKDTKMKHPQIITYKKPMGEVILDI